MATTFVARDGDRLTYLAFIVVLVFYNVWEYRSTDCCFNIDDESRLVKFRELWFSSPLLLTCMGGWVHTWPKYALRWFLKVIR